MRRPPVSPLAVFAVCLLLATGTGVVLVLAQHGGSEAATAALTQDPSVGPGVTPSEKALPTAPPSAQPTPAATAPATTVAPTTSPTHAPAPDPTRAAAPSPTPTTHPEIITVSVTGPTDVVEGVEYTYTFRTTWNHERPAADDYGFSNGGGLPRSGGCTPPSGPPAHDGPGSRTVQAKHTWTRGAAVTNIQVKAFTSCQWYTGAASKVVEVHVRAAPTPSPTTT